MFHKCAGCISHFFQEVGLTSLDVLELSLGLVSLLRQSVALREGKTTNNRVDSLDADPQQTVQLTATKTLTAPAVWKLEPKTVVKVAKSKDEQTLTCQKILRR